MDNGVCFVGGNSTCCRTADTAWVDSVAADVTAALRELTGASMVVSGYTPPWPDEQPDGFLLVELTKEAATAAVGVVFGFRNSQGMEREGFDAEAWRSAPEAPHSSGIVVANFDEAWRLVCRLGEKLGVRRVELCYGL